MHGVDPVISPPVMKALREASLKATGLELLLLFGSRARGDAGGASDWDFGYQSTADLDVATLSPWTRQRTSHDEMYASRGRRHKLHHWSFDRGLFSIDDNYKIVVATTFSESGNEDFSLAKLQSKQIFLPKEKPFRPSITMLRWHRQNTFNS